MRRGKQGGDLITILVYPGVPYIINSRDRFINHNNSFHMMFSTTLPLYNPDPFFPSHTTRANLGPKCVRLAHKWEKSGTFSNHISVNFRLPSQNVLNYELENIPDLSHLDQSDPLWAQTWSTLVWKVTNETTRPSR